MRNFFSMFWSDRDNIWSSHRVIAVLVTMIIVVVMFGVWAFLSIKNGAMVAIPDSVTWTALSLIGTAIAGKVVNSRLSENKGEK